MFIAHYVGFSEGEIEWALWSALICYCEHIVLSSFLVRYSFCNWDDMLFYGGTASWLEPLYILCHQPLRMHYCGRKLDDGHCKYSPKLSYGDYLWGWSNGK